jgi:hypothetical protein
VHRARGRRDARLGATGSAQPTCGCRTLPERLAQVAFNAYVFFQQFGHKSFFQNRFWPPGDCALQCVRCAPATHGGAPLRAGNAFQPSARQILMHNLRQMALPARQSAFGIQTTPSRSVDRSMSLHESPIPAPGAHHSRRARRAVFPFYKIAKEQRRTGFQPVCSWGSPVAKRQGNLSLSIIPRPCNSVTTIISIFLPFLELKNRLCRGRDGPFGPPPARIRT